MPRYQPPHYIDNRKPSTLKIGPYLNNENTLAYVLNKTILEQEQEKLWIASGYFAPNTWILCKDFLRKVKEFRLLLGTEPSIEKINEKIDLINYFKDEMKKELESLPFEEEHVQLINELIEFLEEDKVEIKILRSPFLHAKAYILDNYVIVGSSNFTYNGLTRNSELNLVKWESPTVNDLKSWYLEFWNHGNTEDYKQSLIDILDASKFGRKEYSPYALFIKVLYEYFKDKIGPQAATQQMGITLAPFQIEGLQEALRIIERNNGVIISDAVGLGKTYIGMGIIEYYIIGKRRRGYIPKGLVICPAQVRDSIWNPKLDEYGIKAKVISQEEVSRADFDYRDYQNYDLILIDESHNFRNSTTNRYQNLIKMIITTPKVRIVLMTATPINNTVWDLYHQLNLITKQNKAHYLPYGISNLESFFKKVDKGGAEITDLLEQCMIRRSRLDIKKRMELGELIELPGIGKVEFPERKLRSINYNLTKTYKGFYKNIAFNIDLLILACYNIDKYKKIKTKDDITKVKKNKAIIAILKTLYLKRLESSIKALQISIERQMNYLDYFLNALKNKKILRSKDYRKILRLEQEEEGERLIEQLTANLEEVDLKKYNLEAIEQAVNSDIKILNDILKMINKITKGTFENQDIKLNEIKNEFIKKLIGKKVLIFTYYEDTAKYLYEQFIKDTKWLNIIQNPQIELISGKTDPDQRQKIIKRFAILSNLTEKDRIIVKNFEKLDKIQKENIKKYLEEESETDKIPLEINNFSNEELQTIEKYLNLKNNEISILISTDVLSEGQNLQDVGYLINYDLHWNPVRMIQRAGRIDRIGSPYKELMIYNTFPEEGLEELLGLVQRLQKRIRDIDRTIGLDASILGETIHPKSLEELRRIKAADNRILDELEQKYLEILSFEEMKFPLMEYIHKLGDSILKDIPLGIHTGFKSGTPGIFFSFKVGERHFWRFYEEGKDQAITDKLKIFQIIKCAESTDRYVPPHNIFPYLKKAINYLIQDLKRVQKIQRTNIPMERINRNIYNIINARDIKIEANLKEKLNNLLENIVLTPFRRDLNKILRNFNKEKMLDEFLTELDEYFNKNKLYTEISSIKLIDEIKKHDIELIGYIILSRIE